MGFHEAGGPISLGAGGLALNAESMVLYLEFGLATPGKDETRSCRVVSANCRSVSVKVSPIDQCRP